GALLPQGQPYARPARDRLPHAGGERVSVARARALAVDGPPQAAKTGQLLRAHVGVRPERPAEPADEGDERQHVEAVVLEHALYGPRRPAGRVVEGEQAT